jgi:type 1 glutamine amidotransferase
MDNRDEEKRGFSRRKLMERIAAAAAAVPLMSAASQAQVPQTAPTGPGPAGRPGGNGHRRVRNGRGPIKVLFITGDHPFDYDQLFAMMDIFGEDITWNHVTQPAAEQFFSPEMSAPYDVFVLYDRAGRTPRTAAEGPAHEPGDRSPGGRDVNFRNPSPALKRGMKAMLQQGKGMVLLHHAIASWVHTWPEYVEMVGGACDWDYPQTIRGVQYPFSGFRGGVQQHITITDKSHPIVQGLGDGFDITDEVYLCPIFPETFHTLLKTDFVPVAANFPAQMATPGGWNHPPGLPLCGWYKAVENSPMAYIQHGHDNTAWSNPAYQTLVLNAIKWAASPEGHSWAKANAKSVFT